MEDILASIRRILNDGDGAAETADAGDSTEAPPEPEPPYPSIRRQAPAAVFEQPANPADDDVFLLDAAMMIEDSHDTIVAGAPTDTFEPSPASPPKPETLVAPETLNATTSSMGALVRALTERNVPIARGNSPTLEDIVRDEIRPLVKSWLDEHLPPMVERLVRVEIERVVGRAVG